MPISTGQFTIVDYNDALTLTGYITSNKQKTQQYNPDTGSYSPDWASSNCILTPSLYIIGNSSDIITNAQVQSITWYEIVAGAETPLANDTNYAISATGAKALTIKTNIVGAAAIKARDYLCKIVYRDPTTNLDLVYKMSISFNVVVNGGGIADAVCWAPDGNIFKNGTIATIKAHCDLWRGSVIDSSLVTYQWFKQDSAVVVDQGAGIGWRKLDGTTNYGITGYVSNEIVIPNSAVLNYAVFKCQIKDTDASSNTYEDYFYDTINIVDQSDVVQVSVFSTGGDVFKNSIGSTVLVAKVFRAGTELDPVPGTIAATAPASPTTNQYWLDTTSNTMKQWNGSAWGSVTYNYTYTYKWYMYNKDGALNVNYGGAGIAFKTGKSLAVSDTDVTVKATFSVEVS